MARFIRGILCGLFLLVNQVSLADEPVDTKQTVDLLLVLAVDVSRSIDDREFRLQREGYQKAFTDSRVLDAITSGVHRAIGVVYFEWSTALQQQVIIKWTRMDSAAAAVRFAADLAESPRPFADHTAISSAIYFAVNLFDIAPFTAHRKLIDISGDGTANDGTSVPLARDNALSKGITINALAILSGGLPDPHTHPVGGLQNYFQKNVICGPSAFVEVAKNFDSFGEAIIRKLLLEIASVR